MVKSRNCTRTGTIYLLTPDRSLWYDLTDPVLEYTQTLFDAQPKPALIDFYEGFVHDLETKINYLKYARMVVLASRCMNDRKAANEFLKKIADRIAINKEAQLLLRIEMAGNLLLLGATVEAGDALVQLREDVEKYGSADSLLFSEFYRLYALYFDVRKDYEEFYQYALQYLAYTPSAGLKAQEKVEWSVKMGMAVILGRKIYNIGELIEKDILKSLTTTDYLWLYDLLQALNGARVSDFHKALEHYKEHIDAVPEIKASIDQLYIKVRILALLDMIFTRQKEERTIAFSLIAKIAEIKEDDVEWLLMKAMSLDLIKGEIDEIEKVVKITWMKPRILDAQRIQIMKDTIDRWKVKVQANLKDLEEKTVDLAKP